MNGVGPVALIAAGIYLGYLTITGQATRFVNFLKGGAVSPPAATTTTTTPAAQQQQADPVSSVTNPWGIFNAGGPLGISTAQQAAANAQVPLTIDPGSLVGTSGG